MLLPDVWGCLGHNYLILLSAEPACIVGFVLIMPHRKKLFVIYKTLCERLKKCSTQSFKECLFFVFCFLGFFLLSVNTLHLICYTYICYWNTFSIKIHYTNYFLCRKTISCTNDFERYLFTLYHIISLFDLFHELSFSSSP